MQKKYQVVWDLSGFFLPISCAHWNRVTFPVESDVCFLGLWLQVFQMSWSDLIVMFLVILLLVQVGLKSTKVNYLLHSALMCCFVSSYNLPEHINFPSLSHLKQTDDLEKITVMVDWSCSIVVIPSRIRVPCWLKTASLQRSSKEISGPRLSLHSLFSSIY